jgi:electron-transferring-flavoprotein dehydrogenase
MQRESMDYDVVVVGAGPAGLSAAIKLRQLAQQKEIEITVCVVEKGSEVGAHIVSGAVFETRALDELEHDWRQKGAPVNTRVTRDEMYFYTSDKGGVKIPNLFVPKSMHNSGNYIVSLGNICRWLAEQAETLGVDIFPGFTAAEVLYDEGGSVKGVATGDMGRAANGSEKASFEPGIELHAKYTLFAEGCRGHLGKQLIEKFGLDAECDAQHYGLGLKELWDIDPQKHEPGLVVHGVGWPLSESDGLGGAFLYHANNNQVAVGLVVDLNYSNPNLSPYDEFQRFKHHPRIAKYLEGGKRNSSGARAITKGGLNSLPKMSMPGALLIGCDAGTLNFAKIKGSHTAMKSGMIAAETIVSAFESGDEGGSDLLAYVDNFKDSWAFEELHAGRNFGAALHKWGLWAGGVWNFIEHNVLAAKMPVTLRDRKPDHEQLAPAGKSKPINYLAPDGKLSFDRLSSVFLSNTNHEEDQPCHLTLKDVAVPITTNLAIYDAPEQRYCPAGVYEIVEQEGEPKLQINAQNCVHCKTCDIKDPTQNIVWLSPEGSGGPNYPNM